MTNSIFASELGRNDRVLRDGDPLPYLVDRVTITPDDEVEVAYSSGDVVIYAPTQTVLVV